jgi:hypothetical protein
VAHAVGMPPIRDAERFQKLVMQQDPDVFRRSGGPWQPPPEDAVLVESFETGDNDESKATTQVELKREQQVQRIVGELIKLRSSSSNKSIPALHVAKFEKDDDKNSHIDFITHCANLRAWNYSIAPTTRINAKVVAGKIIAALASTTCAITGLVEIEFLKLALGLKIRRRPRSLAWDAPFPEGEFAPYRGANLNLGSGTFTYSEPSAVKRRPLKAAEGYASFPERFSSWDKIVVDTGKELTLAEFCTQALPAALPGCTVDVMTKLGVTEGMPLMLADVIYPAQRNLLDLYIEKYGAVTPAGRNYVMLDVMVMHDGAEKKIPPVMYRFPARAVTTATATATNSSSSSK